MMEPGSIEPHPIEHRLPAELLFRSSRVSFTDGFNCIKTVCENTCRSNRCPVAWGHATFTTH